MALIRNLRRALNAGSRIDMKKCIYTLHRHNLRFCHPDNRRDLSFKKFKIPPVVGMTRKRSLWRCLVYQPNPTEKKSQENWEENT
jgi:hypothetical protein